MSKAPGKPLSVWAQVGYYTSLGFILPAAAVGGFGLGWCVDRWLHTSPAFAMILGLAGAVAGIVEVLTILKRAEKRESSHDGPGTS